MTTPSGDILASATQVQRLEEIVQHQAIQLATLQKESLFFKQGLKEAIDQQVEEASKRRGMHGSDYVNISKFITRQIGFAVAEFKETIQHLLANAIPVKTVQALEKRLLAKPSATDDLSSLSARVSSLEIQGPPTQIQSRSHIQHQVSADPVAPQELETLKTHIQQLEGTLMKEIQRAYATVYNPKELGGPVGQLQSQVYALQQDIQSLKRSDGQSIAEALITTAAATLRHEFQDYMGTRASSKDLAAFRTDIQRVEEFSRDVQTGFYAMRQAYQPLFETLKSDFSAEKWSTLEKQLKTQVGQAIEDSIRKSNISLDFQASKIQSFVETSQKRLETVSADIRSQYGPEMVQMHIQRLQTALEARQTPWFEGIESHMSKRLVSFEKEIQQHSHQIQQFIETTTAEIEATSLKAKYAEFETLLEMQRKQLSSWKQKLEDQTKQHTQSLESLADQRYAVKQELKDASLEVQSIRDTISATKQELKKELDSWLQDRQGQIQQRFTDAATEIQQIRDAFLLLKSNLLQEIQEHKQKEKYSEFQRLLETKIQNWSQGQTDYFQRRMVDFGNEIQLHLQQVKEREKQLETLFSEDTMRGFVQEVQHRLRQSQDDWTQRRTEELQLRFSELARDNTAKLQTLESIHQQAQTALQQVQDNQTKESTYVRALTQDLINQTREQHAHQAQETLQLQRDMRDTTQTLAEELKTTYQRDSAALKPKEQELEHMRELTQEFITKTSAALVKQKADAQQLQTELRDTLRTLLTTFKAQHEGEITTLRCREQESEVKLAQMTSQFNALRGRIQKLVQAAEKSSSKQMHPWAPKHALSDPFQERYNGSTRCFYTAIFASPGQTPDTLAPIDSPIPGWDAICFTNLDLPPTPGWTIVKQPLTEDPRLAAKRVKWQSHTLLEDYDIVVWVDAYIAPNKMYAPLLQQWILQMMQANATIGHRKHKERDCVYEECDAVIQFKRDTSTHVEALRKELEAAHVPPHNGLYDTNIMVRFHKDIALQHISNTILQALQTFTYRDQLITPLLYYTEQFNSIYTAEFLKAFVKSGTHIRTPV
jgi:hypothetical protein